MGLLLLLPPLYGFSDAGEAWTLTAVMATTVKNILGLFGFALALVVGVLAERLYRRRLDSRFLWLAGSGLITACLQAEEVLRGSHGSTGVILGQYIAFAGLILAGGSAAWQANRWMNKQKIAVIVTAVAAGLIYAGSALPTMSLPLLLKVGIGPLAAASLIWVYHFPRCAIFLRGGLALALILMATALVAAAGEPSAGMHFTKQIYLIAAFFSLLPGLWARLVEMPLTAQRRLWNIRQREIGRREMGMQHMEREHAIQDEALGRLGAVVNRREKLTILLDDLVNQAARYFGVEHVYISLVEGTPPQLWVVAYKGNFQLREIGLEQKFMGAKYKNGETVKVDNFFECLSRLRPEISRAGLRALVGAPVMIDGQLAGVVEIYYSLPGPISEKHVRMSRVYADQIAVALRMNRILDDKAKKDDELALLSEVACLVVDQSTPAMLLERVGKMISKFLRSDAYAIFHVQRQADMPQIRPIDTAGFTPIDIERMKSLFSKGQLGGVLHQSENDSGSRRSVMIQLTLATGKKVEVLPLFFQQTLRGVMVFFWEYERKAEIRSSVEDTLKTIAILAAFGLDREQLYGNFRKMGLTDTLTEIANRRLFDYTIKRDFNRMRRYGRPLSLMMVDIDFFKKVNDTWGHQAGDVILKELGGLLKTSFRVTDFPARYGGEEFAVVLPETGPEAAYGLAEKFRIMVAGRLFAPQGERISLTVSIGVATFDVQTLTGGGEVTENDLILAADQSLFRAKHLGRNRVEVWDGIGKSESKH